MNIRKIINITYIALESILYIFILTNLFNLSRLYSYLSIIINFIYALTFIKEFNNKRQLFMYIGLFTTLIADFFLVAIGKYKGIAMTSFSFTQIAYALFILDYSNNKKLDLIVRIIGSGLVILSTIIILKDKIDYLSIVSMFYFFNLILNAILSFIRVKPLTFKIGLVLFIFCDIFVGLRTAMGVYFNINESLFIYKLITMNFNVIWLFYLPSQVLLSLTFNFINVRNVLGSD